MYVARSSKYLLKSPNYPQRSSKTSFDLFQASKLNIFPSLCFVTRRKIEEFQETFALFPHVNSSFGGFPFGSVSLGFSCIFQIFILMSLIYKYDKFSPVENRELNKKSRAYRRKKHQKYRFQGENDIKYTKNSVKLQFFHVCGGD